MFSKLLQKPLILLVIVLLAIAFVVVKVKTRAPLEHANTGLPPTAVEFITLKPLPFRTRAMAYGHVEPAAFLKAKAEVSGKVSYVHPDLQKGGSLGKDTVVLRIEPTTFELTLNQSQAGLEASKSSLRQLEVEQESTRRSLQIAQKNLEVGEAELARVKKIFERKLVAQSAVDAEEQRVLALRQQLQDIQGRLSAFESRMAATAAQIDQSQSQVSQSQDTLGRTEVRIPFDARVGAVLIEEGEFVSAGSVLFEALGVAAVEINAELPTSRLRPLIVGAVDREADQMQSVESMQRVLSELNLEAHVKLVGDPTGEALWNGTLTRISESVDPTRDTIGLLVRVENPYSGIIPGKRPPLVKGMFTAVEFVAPQHEALVIPRKALHQGRVYVIDENDQLDIRPVDVAYRQGEMIVLADEQPSVAIGDRIIVSDVIPVMPGLPLKPVDSTAAEQSLARHALDPDDMSELVPELQPDAAQ